MSPSVCGRIPVRTNDDCRYFQDTFQLIPVNGYTELFKNMLRHPNIEILLSTDYKNLTNDISFNKIIYTGPIDYFFNYLYGKLPYRSIRFEFEHYAQEFYQETAQINHVSPEVEFTRVVEFKHMTEQNISSTTISREFPRFEGEPFYPIPSDSNRVLYLQYKREADKLKNVIFCGRLAEYRYFNMDQVVANSLMIFEKLLK